MKKRRKGMLKLAGLAAALALGMAAGETISYAVVYVNSSEDWEDEDFDDEEETSYSRTRSRTSEDERGGPGETEVETDSVILQGPSVSQAAPKEQYHEEYKIYEESIEDVFFFYANVKNGGITHETVVLDIPQNLSYTVELNGVPWTYQTGEPISTYGTYVFKFTGIENTNLPLSEQKEYQAVFRFRIQEKPPEETKEETEAEEESLFSSGSSDSEWRSFTYDGTPVENEEALIRMLRERSQESEAAQENWSIWAEQEESQKENEETQEETTQETEEETEESQKEETSEAQESESSLSEEESQEENPENTENTSSLTRQTGNGYISRTQVYHPTIGYYEVTFADGKTLTSNVPEGYIGPGEVELIFPEEAQIRLYRDDEQMDETEGNRLTQPGHYRVEVDGQPWFCTIASSIGQENLYPAPSGMHFVSATLDGETIPLSSERYVSMEKDGQYQFALEGEREETLTIDLRKDTMPPQAEIRVKGGEASIQYLSDDIETIVLEKDGEVQEGFSGYSISRPGNYQLVLADAAGNTSSFRFSLSYKINKYGIIAGILVVLLIAGGVGFVIYTKRTVKIR